MIMKYNKKIEAALVDIKTKPNKFVLQLADPARSKDLAELALE